MSLHLRAAALNDPSRTAEEVLGGEGEEGDEEVLRPLPPARPLEFDDGDDVNVEDARQDDDVMARGGGASEEEVEVVVVKEEEEEEDDDEDDEADAAAAAPPPPPPPHLPALTTRLLALRNELDAALEAAAAAACSSSSSPASHVSLLRNLERAVADARAEEEKAAARANVADAAKRLREASSKAQEAARAAQQAARVAAEAEEARLEAEKAHDEAKEAVARLFGRGQRGGRGGDEGDDEGNGGDDDDDGRPLLNEKKKKRRRRVIVDVGSDDDEEEDDQDGADLANAQQAEQQQQQAAPSSSSMPPPPAPPAAAATTTTPPTPPKTTPITPTDVAAILARRRNAILQLGLRGSSAFAGVSCVFKGTQVVWRADVGRRVGGRSHGGACFQRACSDELEAARAVIESRSASGCDQQRNEDLLRKAEALLAAGWWYRGDDDDDDDGGSGGGGGGGAGGGGNEQQQEHHQQQQPVLLPRGITRLEAEALQPVPQPQPPQERLLHRNTLLYRQRQLEDPACAHIDAAARLRRELVRLASGREAASLFFNVSLRRRDGGAWFTTTPPNTRGRHERRFALDGEADAAIVANLTRPGAPNARLLGFYRLLLEGGYFEDERRVEAILLCEGDAEAAAVPLPAGVTRAVARALVPLPKLIELSMAGRLPLAS